MMFNTRCGESGLISAIILIIFMVVGVSGFIFLTSTFDEKYEQIGNDTGNNTGIMTSGETFDLVQQTGNRVATTSPWFIFLTLLFGALALIAIIYAVLRR